MVQLFVSGVSLRAGINVGLYEETYHSVLCCVSAYLCMRLFLLFLHCVSFSITFYSVMVLCGPSEMNMCHYRSSLVHFISHSYRNH